jgi:hypothetical protein
MNERAQEIAQLGETEPARLRPVHCGQVDRVENVGIHVDPETALQRAQSLERSARPRLGPVHARLRRGDPAAEPS